jgi:large subunit ribosomal protein L3
MLMALGLLGLKVGMTQVYDDQGKLAPVTVLQVGPCPILQIRTQDRDGYDAVQLGFLDKPRNKATLPERGHVASKIESKRRQYLTAAGVQIPDKADVEPQRYIREFRLEQPSELKVGVQLTAAEVFQDVKHVDVISNSKGRGTAGAMKRHGFSGLPASHGVKKHHRAVGSIGSHASNRGSGRPKKGHKAAGRLGNARITVRNLDVVKVDAHNHLILVRGSVPGPNGGLVMIRPTNKKS